MEGLDELHKIEIKLKRKFGRVRLKNVKVTVNYEESGPPALADLDIDLDNEYLEV